MYDVDDLRKQIGKHWAPFLEYNLECASDGDKKEALQIMMKEVGIPRIPREDLTRIDIPADLIWGRYDRANYI